MAIYPACGRNVRYRWITVLAALITAVLLCPGLVFARGPVATKVEIRRTSDDIPHIKANSWRGVGVGFGFAQAQDALCTLAEGFVTYAGERSLHFGGEGRPAIGSTFGKPINLDLDFFFQAFAGREAVSAYLKEQPADFRDLVAGYAEGYSRYVKGLAVNPSQRAAHECAGAAWVRPIAPEDVYRRLIAATLAGGYARFVSEIANAQPGLLAPAVSDLDSHLRSLEHRLQVSIGEVHGLGSNMIAFGSGATGEKNGVLFGNPHWYWGGADRFYQAHLTLPGRLNVAGVSFLGAPVIMLGFNDHVAWSHTVSSTRRFGFFELALDPGNARRYMVDGKSLPMLAQELAVVSRLPSGELETIRRTLYRTQDGPVIDFGKYDPALGWGTRRALVLRDVNETNHRAFRNFFRWNQARSLDEFIQIQQEESAMPWVNTAAIGRGDGRTWYSDQGAVPNIPDSLRTACAAPISASFARIDPVTPVLDGQRSECRWPEDAFARQQGAMPATALPHLLRSDYVANMNDSYWLSNPGQPLEGYPSSLGGERRPLSMRSREGHRIAGDLIAGRFGSSLQLASEIMLQVLAARSYAATEFKTELLQRACTVDTVALVAQQAGKGGKQEKDAAPRIVDIREACEVLSNWSNKAGTSDRGAILWETWWLRLQQLPASELYATTFSAADPLRTPGGIRASSERIGHTLALAVAELGDRALALNAPLGSYRFALSEGQRIPIYGGCEKAGFFTVACSEPGGAMTVNSVANTYLQVVTFANGGVKAHTLLAHGQKETAVSGGAGGEPVLRYARKDWLPFPFHESDLARDPSLRVTVLTE